MKTTDLELLQVKLLAAILRRLRDGDQPGRAQYESLILAQADLATEKGGEA